jgi:hypothetical protein
MFEFKKSGLGLTEEDVKNAEDKIKNGGGKFLTPGIHSVKITEAEFSYKDGSCMNKKDPTWANVVITVENAAGASMKHWVLIPTSKLLFNEGESKRPEFMYIKFRGFCHSVGIEMSTEYAILTKSMTKYFKDPKKLIGLTGDVEVGYEGPYIKYLGTNEYQICKADGSIICPDIFDTKENALLKAVDLKLTIEGYPKITKFLEKAKKVEKEVLVEAEVKSEDW